MSNMRIRNMFLLVTALAVVFTIACGGGSEYDEDIASYTKAIELNPDDDDAYYNRGWAYGKLEQYDKAIDDYTKSIQLNPDESDAYNNRGWAYSLYLKNLIIMYLIMETLIIGEG